MIGQSRRCMTVSKQDKERQIEIKRRRVKINDSIYKFLSTAFFATLLFSNFFMLIYNNDTMFVAKIFHIL